MIHPPSDPVRLRLAELHREELHAEVSRERLAQQAVGLAVIHRAGAALLRLPRGVGDLARAVQVTVSCAGSRPPGKPRGEWPIRRLTPGDRLRVAREPDQGGGQ